MFDAQVADSSLVEFPGASAECTRLTHSARHGAGRSLSTFHEVPKLRYQAIKAQEYTANQPEQTEPWPVKIFTEIITTD